jgi:hypothetical protein
LLVIFGCSALFVAFPAVSLPPHLNQFSEGATNAAWLWYFLVSGWPSFTLMRAIAVRLLCLVVEKDLLRWEGQVNTISSQLILDCSQNLVSRVEIVSTPWR